MKKEISCGAVVYDIFDGVVKFLLVKHINGKHWAFPKGHIENNETKVETALREIKEETGLDVNLDDNFCKMVSYNVGSYIIKDVFYFVAKNKDTNSKVVLQREEISKYGWFDFDKALSILTFQNDKNVLTSAKEYLKKTLRI